MKNIKTRIREVYERIEAESTRHKVSEPHQLASGHLLVPRGHEDGDYIFGSLTSLSPAAAYYAVEYDGHKAELGIPRQGEEARVAFQLYESLEILFDTLTTGLLPQTRVVTVFGLQCRLYPYFDMSLHQALRITPFRPSEIVMYLEQLARFLQISELSGYDLGIYRSDYLFINSGSPLLLTVPEFNACRKIGPVRQPFYQEDTFRLGALIYEMATGEELLVRGSGLRTEFTLIRQLLQLFGPGISFAIEDNFFVKATREHADVFAKELNRLGFTGNEVVFPRAEVLFAKSAYDHHDNIAEPISEKLKRRVSKIGGRLPQGIEEIGKLVDALVATDGLQKFETVAKFLEW